MTARRSHRPVVGIVIGALPGLTATMGVALLEHPDIDRRGGVRPAPFSRVRRGAIDRKCSIGRLS